METPKPTEPTAPGIHVDIRQTPPASASSPQSEPSPRATRTIKPRPLKWYQNKTSVWLLIVLAILFAIGLAITAVFGMRYAINYLQKRNTQTSLGVLSPILPKNSVTITNWVSVIRTNWVTATETTTSMATNLQVGSAVSTTQPPFAGLTVPINITVNNQNNQGTSSVQTNATTTVTNLTAPRLGVVTNSAKADQVNRLVELAKTLKREREQRLATTNSIAKSTNSPPEVVQVKPPQIVQNQTVPVVQIQPYPVQRQPLRMVTPYSYNQWGYYGGGYQYPYQPYAYNSCVPSYSHSVSLGMRFSLGGGGGRHFARCR